MNSGIWIKRAVGLLSSFLLAQSVTAAAPASGSAVQSGEFKGSALELGSPDLRGPGFGQPEVLPVDEAFALKVVREEEGIQLLWQIRPGYYLYRHRLGVAGSTRLGEPVVPRGVEREDEYFGEVEVYYEALMVDVPLSGGGKVDIEVQYQGCADAGICYPPQKRRFSL